MGPDCGAGRGWGTESQLLSWGSCSQKGPESGLCGGDLHYQGVVRNRDQSSIRDTCLLASRQEGVTHQHRWQLLAEVPPYAHRGSQHPTGNRPAQAGGVQEAPQSGAESHRAGQSSQRLDPLGTRYGFDKLFGLYL